VNRIGSLVLRPVVRNVLLNQRAIAGDALSSKLARNVSRSAMYITLPVEKFTPRVGSPACSPRPLGGL
jgi:hypothetical protein